VSNFFRPSSYAVMVSPDLKHAWINIPKNASSFCHTVFTNNGWTMCHEDDLVDGILLAHTIKKIVVLRDPVERWISGFSQCMTDSPHKDLLELLDNNAFWHTVRINPVFDDHTEYQHRFIGAAQNVKYINMQSRNTHNEISDPNRFYRDLTAFVRSTGGTSDFQYWEEPTNPAENDPKKIAIYNKLRAIIKEKDHRNCILREAFTKDYELYNTLQKFET
jgi:hypothetical protein